MKWFFKGTGEEFYEDFGQFFEKYYDRVYKTAYFVTRDRFLAQDAVQETFLKAFRFSGDITDPAKLGAWLSVIASNTAIDLLRKRNRWNGIPTEHVLLLKDARNEETASTVEAKVLTMLRLERLSHFVQQLKPLYKQVLLLKYRQGLKDEEIANMLRVNIGTVKSRIHRAKHQLKQKMAVEEAAGEGELT